MYRSLIIALAWLLSAGAASPATGSNRLTAFLDGLHTLQADFRQTVITGTTRYGIVTILTVNTVIAVTAG